MSLLGPMGQLEHAQNIPLSTLTLSQQADRPKHHGVIVRRQHLVKESLAHDSQSSRVEIMQVLASEIN